MSKKSPQLRFEGFTDDWEERKLGDYSENTFGGGTPKTGIDEYWTGDIPWIQSSDLKKEQLYNVQPSKFITDDAVKNSATKLVPKNSIAIVTRVGVGKLALLPFEYATSQDFLSLSNLKVDKWFGIYSTYTMLQKELNNIQGTSIKGITKPELLKKKMRTPSLIDEQSKIGTLFKQLDDIIALHQSKLDLLKEQKKGFLQKMFPKNGAKVPELRFAGFADDWEERKLGDVVGEIQSGNRLPKDSLTSGNIPYVVAQTKNEGVFKTISKKTLDYNGNPMKLFPGNSISFSIDNPEAMFYRSTEFYTSNIMRVIHADYLSHQQYLFILENMKSFTRGYDWSRKFSGPVVSNLEYLQPNEQEQCKIGSFILAFDNIITLHQRKLDLLKEQKKGLLQKMFV